MTAGSAPPPDPFDAVLREHADAARRLARHLVFDPDRADEVAQEALRVALVRPAAPGRSPRAWLQGIVRNVARAFVRRETQRKGVEARAIADADARRHGVTGDDPATLVARAEEHRRAVEAVLQLDEPYRAALILRFLEDHEPSEVARRQGVPLETARTRIRRGLELVRRDLDAGHGGDRRAWLLLLAPVAVSPPSVVPPTSPLATSARVASGALAVKKLAAVALLLLLVGGAWMLVPWPRGSPTTGEPAESALAPPDSARRDVTLAAGGGAPADALPSPLDLDAPGVVDRDRDVHGWVVREDGTPVAGAEVAALLRPWIGGVLLGTYPEDDENVAARGHTASDGTFRLRLERGAAVTLRVTASGLAAFEEELVGAGERLRVVLHPGVRFVVVVKDATGAPVEHATVRMHRLTGQTTGGYARSSYRREGATGADGRFVFEDLASVREGPWTLLDVEVPGIGPSTHERVDIPEHGEATHEVVLRAVGTLRGRVTDAETNQPLAGAVVGFGWSERPRVTTDADGRYAMPMRASPSGPTVCAEAVGYAWSGDTRVNADGVLDFALARVATLRGRLLDASGAPVAAAVLTAHGTMGAALPTGRGEARSAGDGRFELVGLAPASTSELWIDAPGFGRRGLALDAIGDARARDLGDLVLAAGRRVEGRVVDGKGAPVAGVSVQAAGASGEQARFFTGTGRVPGRLVEGRVTDDLGRFRFACLAPGTYTLTALAPGQPKQTRDVIVGGVDVVDLEFTLRAGRTLLVNVRGPDGKPVSFAEVMVLLPDGSTHSERAEGTSRVVFTVPDDDVRVQVVGSPMGQRPPRARFVRRGTEEITIALLAFDEWILEGLVLDSEGLPLPHAVVLASTDDSPFGPRTQADVRGRFRMLLGDAVRATLTLTGDTFDPATERDVLGAFEGDPFLVIRGTKDVVLRARRSPVGQTLRIVVQDPEGKVLAGIPVRLQWPVNGGFLPRGVANEDGSIGFRDLVARPFDVVRGSGVYTLEPTWVDPYVSVVPAGQTIVYRFVAGVLVQGVVIGPDGAPVPDAFVAANAPRQAKPRSVQARQDGRFSMAVDPERHLPLTLVVRAGGAGAGQLVGQAEFTTLPLAPVTIRLAPAPPPGPLWPADGR